MSRYHVFCSQTLAVPVWPSILSEQGASS
jgi:hypothetical protein